MGNKSSTISGKGSDFTHILSFQGLFDALRASSSSKKGIIFIEGKEKEVYMSYKELYKSALRIAKHLRINNIPKHSEVIIQAADNLSFVPMFWGCLVGGYKPIPLSLGFTDDHRLKLLHIWELLENPWLLHNAPESFFPQLKQTASENGLERFVDKIQSNSTALDGYESCVELADLPEYSKKDVVFVQFSSGSTGKPKGVSITNQNILDNIYYTTRLQKFDQDDRFFNWMPLTHDMGLIYYHIQGVVLQMDQCQMPTQLFIRYPSLWMHKMSEHRASHSASPNFGYRFFLDYYNKEMAKEWDLSCIKYLLNAAEPISLKIYEKFASEMESLGLNRSALHAGYGLAEATLVVSMRTPGEGMKAVSLDRNKLGVGSKVELIDKSHPDSLEFALCGVCIESVDVRFTNDSGKILEDGHIGHLEMKGISVVDGYYRNPDATKNAITSDGWFKTGDLGFRWEGEIVITGRSKEIIFVGGLNYYPHDVESSLHDVEGLGLNKIVATGIQNPETGLEELVLFVYYKAKMDAFPHLVETVKDTLLQRMGLQAQAVIPIKQIPKTTSGKLRRVFLAEQYKQGDFDAILIESGQKPFKANSITEKSDTPEVSVQSISENKTVAPNALTENILSLLKKITGLSTISHDASFDELGINSMKAIQFHEKLELMTESKLPVSVAFDYPNVQKLADYIGSKTQTPRSASSVDTSKSEIRESEMAIVGLSFRLPGEVNNLDDLWSIFNGNPIQVIPYPTNRPNSSEWSYIDPKLTQAAYLTEISGFDSQFFGITEQESASMDPQQRLLLESVYHAIQDAGWIPESLKERNIGVFTGVGASEYRNIIIKSGQTSPYDITGNLTSTAAGRISYIFGFRGPAMAIDTACSSSLVALHQACHALESGETEVAVVSGVNLIIDVNGTLGLHEVQALSPDGRCKTFDESANGYGRAEGVISIILKPLSRALSDGDNIYAVVTSTSINHDGRSNGLTAPNGQAQKQLIQHNLKKAGITASDLFVIETHGTGTKLGDPQELSAWTDVFEGLHASHKPFLSAAKSHFGHLESAAGLLGVLKSILMLQKGKVPAHTFTAGPSTHTDWGNLPMALPVLSVATSIPVESRYAAISSFGLSGTNAHVVLRGQPITRKSITGHTFPSALVASARSEAALQSLTESWSQFLNSKSEGEIADALVAQIWDRNVYEFRLSVAGNTINDLKTALSGRKTLKKAPLFKKIAPIGWLFTGQGSQTTSMFKTLYEQNADFKGYVSQCQGHLDEIESGINLETFILQADERIHLTRFTQPVLAALEWSLARLLLDLGIQPGVVCGHSLGEIVALCVSGVISVKDMLMLVVHRGRLMSDVTHKGGMIVTFASVESTLEIIKIHSLNLDIASVNTSQSTTVSGPKDQIDQFEKILIQSGIRSKTLTVEQAFHSHLMDEILDEFSQIASGISYHPAQIPVILNVSGEVLNSGSSIDANYLTHQIRSAVQFTKCMDKLGEMSPKALIEVGPTPALSPLAASAGICEHIACVSDRQYDSHTAFLACLGMLYEWGIDFNLEHILPERPSGITLPKYPFQHSHHWVSTQKNMSSQYTSQTPDSASKQVNWTSTIKNLVAESTGFPVDMLHESVNLFELGLDSLVLLKVKARIKEEFNVEIAASQFFSEANTIEKIAGIVESQSEPVIDPMVHTAPAATMESPAISTGISTSASGDYVQQLIDEQLKLMHRQLDLLQGTGSSHHVTSPSTAIPVKPPVKSEVVVSQAQKPSNYVAYKSVKNAQRIGQIPPESLQKLINEYTSITSASKNEVSTYRKWLATSRNIAGFRPDRKEMVYQLHIDRAEGAYVYDIDGNKLLDITMGFGVSLFGNKPAFLQQEMVDELQRGVGVGAMSYRAGRVAKKFCDLTRHDRVAFFNSGSEAVMNAIRIARTHRKRDLVVQFSGAYHGNMDPILGVGSVRNGKSAAMPMSPGVPESYVNDHVVLDYDSPASLQEIESRAEEIAAVIVEPVQSRKPDLQPTEFLRKLREITSKHGIVLIFDETITGLRAGKQGAQGFFGVKADLATYGKIVGGGLPIGLVAGASNVMGAVDGGLWNYGDESYPEIENTFSAGTFNHHPLVLATMEAVLDTIVAQGDTIYPELERMTSRLTNTLNDYFKQHHYPVSMVHFGSLFRFNVTGPGELLFYKLVTKGVYIWEGRNCFISTAHTDADIDFLIQAVKDAVDEMRNDGFFPDGGSQNASGNDSPENAQSAAKEVDQHPIQQRMFALSNLDSGDEAYQIRGAMKITGDFDVKKFEQVCDVIFRGNDAFSTTFSVVHGKLVQHIHTSKFPVVEVVDGIGKDINQLIDQAIAPIPVFDWPLVRVSVIRSGTNEHILVINAHHIALDGYSLSIFFEQFLTLYFGGEVSIASNLKYEDFVRWQKAYERSAKFEADAKYWEKVLDSIPAPVVPACSKSPDSFTFEGGRIVKRIAIKDLRKTAREMGVSVYALVFGSYALWFNRVTKSTDFVIGSVIAGRPEGFEKTMGMFVNTIPYRFNITPGTIINSVIRELSSTILKHLDASFYPYQKLLEHTNREREAGTNPFFETILSYEKDTQRSIKAGGLSFETHDVPRRASGFPLLFDLIETEYELIIGIEYQSEHYDEKRVHEIAESYIRLLCDEVKNHERSIDQLSQFEFQSATTSMSHKVNSEELMQAVAEEVPRNGTLRSKLAGIWTEILGKEVVDHDASFFWLGGDSIKAIQIVSRLAELGFKTKINTIFKNPTVNKLASVLELEQPRNDATLDKNFYKTLPIHDYFFSLELDQPSFWNQAIHLSTGKSISDENIRAIFDLIAAKYPILCSKISPDGFALPYKKFDSTIHIQWIDQSNQSRTDDLIAQFHETFVKLQSGQSISDGKLVSVLVARTAETVDIFWGIHHLVTDAVSWPMFVRDFSVMYKQAHEGKALKIPHSELDSLGRWSELRPKFESETRMDEVYWQQMSNGDMTTPLVNEFCKVGSLKTRSISLSPQLAQRINGFIQKYGGRTIESAIISATYSILESESGQSYWFWNEFHGRQFRSDEITQAPGWFTSMYPVKILSQGKKISASKVLDTLNRIPENGFGFGYQSIELNRRNDSEKPQVRFNFLGEFPNTFEQFDVHIIDNMFTMHTANKHDVALDVNTVFSQGCWNVNFDYHPGLVNFHPESFEEALEQAFDELESHNIAEKSVSDFFNPSKTSSHNERLELVNRYKLAPNSMNVHDCYPLTPLQQGLIYHAQLKSTIQSGLQQLVLQFDSHLDQERLQKSLQKIVQRHAPLRTVFSDTLGDPVQLVTETVPGLKLTDLTGLSLEAFNSTFDELLVRDLRTPFILFKQPPVRFEYVMGPNQKSALVFTVHHIIYDGWSNDLFLKELSGFYSGQELPNVEGKWADFVKVCRSLAQKDTTNYWIPLLSQNVTTNPLDWARLPQNGNSHSITPGEYHFDSIVESDIRERAQSEQSTLSTLIQTAWGLTLLTAGSHERVTFGSVYSGRYGHSTEISDHIGLFISTVPFCMQLDVEKTPFELLQTVHHDMVSHQDHPFANLPEIATELGVQELFDSILVIENYPLRSDEYVFNNGEGPNVSISAYRFYSEESVPLTVAVNYNPDFHIEIRYNASRFQRSAIKKLAEIFEYMMMHLTNTEFGTIGELVAAWKKSQADNLKSKSLGKLTALKNK